MRDAFERKNITHSNYGDRRTHFIICHILRSSLLLLPAVAFAPPSQILTRRRLSSLQRLQADAKFGSTIHVMSSSSDSPQVVSNHREVNGSIKRRIISGENRLSSMSKIKSPSNSYSQYYKEGVLVGIERTSTNSRRISGEVIMDVPISAAWGILTDYDNLSVHVPNLVESSVVNIAGVIAGERPRVYQRGAQRIFGFEFGGDVTLDMSENIHNQNCHSVDFESVASPIFSQFDGSWLLEEYSNSRTMVRYIVDVRPKGPVPVAALEWRIKEDVPNNILAVLRSARALSAEQSMVVVKNNVSAEQEPVALIPDRQHEQQQQLRRVLVSSAEQVVSYPPQQPMRDATLYLLKQTAKTFFPLPIISMAKQAMEVIYNPNSLSIAPPMGTWRKSIAPSKLLNGGSRRSAIVTATTVSTPATTQPTKSQGTSKISGRENLDIDWYQDETMAMYIDD
jgi:hypothetical protein